MNLNKEQLIKIGKGALIAGAGAALASIIEALPNVDLGTWGPFIGALLSVALNALRKARA